MTAHSPAAQPPLNRLFKNRLLLVGVPSAAVDDAHATVTRARGRQNEFVQGESRRLLVHSVQIDIGLNGKFSGSQIV